MIRDVLKALKIRRELKKVERQLAEQQKRQPAPKPRPHLHSDPGKRGI